MTQYKALFLDWDDTIGSFHGAAKKALQAIYDKYEFNRWYPSFDDFHSFYFAHNLELWARYGRDEVSKDFLQYDRFAYPLVQKGVLPQVQLDEHLTMADAVQVAKMLPLPRQIGDDFLQWSTDFFELLPDAERMVRYLASRYPLTIVSNGFIEVQYDKIRRSGLEDCFQHIVLSEEVGVQKPNPKIYEVALQKGHWRPEEVLMIGDSWTSDIQGAINAGIDQLWIITPHLMQDESLPATYKVHSLQEVIAML